MLSLQTAAFGQDDDRDDAGKVRKSMMEYMQKRLGLSRAEAERFEPVFLNYYNELRRTTRENRGDKLVLQQKIVDLKLRYREQFKNIMGEKRSNDVFIYERDFVEEVKELRNERLMNQNNRPNKRGGQLQ
jgi:hypothetical protein